MDRLRENADSQLWHEIQGAIELHSRLREHQRNNRTVEAPDCEPCAQVFEKAASKLNEAYR
jgi:hypothetical protein